MARAERIVAAARALVGVPFRPQGRDPAWGLDCAGVALVAAGATGPTPDYALSGDNAGRIAAAFAAAGWVRTGAPAASDIVELAAAGHRHLAVLTPSGAVHAHAGLRRVVEGPVPPEWVILRAWTIGKER